MFGKLIHYGGLKDEDFVFQETKQAQVLKNLLVNEGWALTKKLDIIKILGCNCHTITFNGYEPAIKMNDDGKFEFINDAIFIGVQIGANLVYTMVELQLRDRELAHELRDLFSLLTDKQEVIPQQPQENKITKEKRSTKKMSKKVNALPIIEEIEKLTDWQGVTKVERGTYVSFKKDLKRAGSRVAHRNILAVYPKKLKGLICATGDSDLPIKCGKAPNGLSFYAVKSVEDWQQLLPVITEYYNSAE